MDFLEYMGPRIKEPDNNTREIMDAFKVFDKNGSREIDMKDLMRYMCELGDRMTEDEAKFILSEAQLEPEGVLNFFEYIKNMMRF
mmetsp:Transcript_33187/g.72433  ORF Transcript_33187/g.72433 Transcript_33187/m.72433 type:complete len:85 (+) Transcript_33187:67-321(+)